MNDGYIKLHRKIVDWEWYDDLPVFRLFIHLLLKANHEDRKWRGSTVKRGSCITSYATLMNETKLSKKQIERALKKLQETGEVEKVTNSQNTLIIITNYNLYQDKGETKEKQRGSEGETKEKQRGSEGETKEKQRGTNKNEKNIKNDKNIRKKENTKEKKIVSFSSILDDYTQNDEHKKVLLSYVDMRNKMKGFTTHALELNLKTLDSLAGDDKTKIEIVNQTIEHSWKSFYKLKNDGYSKQQIPKQSSNPYADILASLEGGNNGF